MLGFFWRSQVLHESEKCSDNTNQQFPCPTTNIAPETGNWEYWEMILSFWDWPVFGGKLFVLGMVWFEDSKQSSYIFLTEMVSPFTSF